MKWDDGIEGTHRDIAASTSRRIGILAGPGTGKTSFGLMRRVVRLLEEGVPGERILLISFTRVAAADLRDKVASLDVPGVDSVRASTLHGYCFGVLQKDAVLEITGRVPRILLDHEVDLMLRDIGGGFGNIHDRRRRLEAFVAGWARGAEDHPGLAADLEDRDFEHAVMTWLRKHRAMLIGEVVPEVHRYLTNNPAAEELNSFDHIIVDEYQDLNLLEQSLLDTLAASSSLCIAGDDDQSIYSVRYANPEGILLFMDRDEVEKHEITVCGRCPENILSMANALIAYAPGRDKAELSPREASVAGPTAIVQWPNVETEIDGIVSAIAGAVGSGHREPGDLLVLTNWRKIGEGIRTRLNELGISARSFFTEEELTSDAGRQALALLRLVADDSDAPALRVLLGLGDATGRSAAYQRLLEFCSNSSSTPAEVLERVRQGAHLDLRIPAFVKIYSRAYGVIERLRGLELNELVEELFPAQNEEVADLRALALDACTEAIDATSLVRAVIEAITQDDVPQNPDFVRVMSLHKSKGLTSPVVYIVGAVHGVLPTLRDDDPDAVDAAIQEGRRLFYVAVTRAADELVISGSSSMDLADANARGVRHDRESIRRVGDRFTVRSIASPYLRELGPAAPRPERGEAWLGRQT
jgi:DNA helicase II / ATP-dependent DNA helicase PcrA